MAKYASYEERFWEKVDKNGPNGCWIWEGAKDTPGYGRFRFHGRNVGSHRLSLHWVTGTDLSTTMFADHTCYTKACVNPEHLRWATPSQNLQNYSPRRRSSATGIRGVYQNPNGSYFGRVMVNKVRHQSKTTKDIEVATAWVQAKRLIVHTHNDLDRLPNTA